MIFNRRFTYEKLVVRAFFVFDFVCLDLLLFLLILFILLKIVPLPFSGREAIVTNIKLAFATVPEDRKIV
jgi:hypothetical protein